MLTFYYPTTQTTQSFICHRSSLHTFMCLFFFHVEWKLDTVSTNACLVQQHFGGFICALESTRVAELLLLLPVMPILTVGCIENAQNELQHHGDMCNKWQKGWTLGKTSQVCTYQSPLPPSCSACLLGMTQKQKHTLASFQKQYDQLVVMQLMSNLF